MLTLVWIILLPMYLPCLGLCYPEWSGPYHTNDTGSGTLLTFELGLILLEKETTVSGLICWQQSNSLDIFCLFGLFFLFLILFQDQWFVMNCIFKKLLLNEKYYISTACLLQYQLYWPGSFLMSWKENGQVWATKRFSLEKLAEHFQTAPFPEPIYTE